MQTMQETPPKLTYMDFNILNEKWSTFKVEDGTVLKARVLLVSFARVEDPKPGEANFFFAIHTVFGVESPNEIRRPLDAATYSPSDLMKDLEPGKEDMKFTTLTDYWSEYVLEDSTRLSLKVSPTRIMRARKADLAGNPQYVVQSVTVPKVVGKDPTKLAQMVTFGATG